MAKLEFSSFRELLKNVGKSQLYDAVKPELQAYAEIRYGGIPIDDAYSKILEKSFKFAGGEAEAPAFDNPGELVRRMGKG